MKIMYKPKIKICCIQNISEAKMAIDFGASALGLVSEMPSGPGPIPEERIAEIVKTIPPPIFTFLLTSKQDVNSIFEQQKQCYVNTIQFCDYLEIKVLKELRKKLQNVRFVQVIHVICNDAIEEAKYLSPYVNAILLDSGNPNAKTKKLGGTGKIHNWQISKSIVDGINVPVFLAGGLTPENVKKAIEFVRPFGVDVCSGVRTDGKLDEEKLARFCQQIVES